VVKQPTLLTELREFVARHRPHGELHAKASAPTPNGYRLEVACPWCVVFERWVLPDDAAMDMALLARWNWGAAPTSRSCCCSHSAICMRMVWRASSASWSSA